MKKNIGNTDKLIRLLLALLIAVLYFTNIITGTLAIVLGILALMLVGTSLVSFCGLYTLLGINTCKRPSRESMR
ncbi:MAG: DUF2892 domain-containing protein [Lentimicrobiaceae bacterium]|nr:DUF2892 domain-containing protein [Lentimicrobiaceae bacterium]